MTIGEMKLLTDRFNQIKGASQICKRERLNVLRSDISEMYNLQTNEYASELYLTVCELC